MKEQCDNCGFCHLVSSDGSCACHRYPEIYTKAFCDWCGEWQPHEIIPESDEDLFCQSCEFYGPVYIRGKVVGYDCQATPGQVPDGCPIMASLTRTNCTTDVTPNNLMAAISRIDQFMKRNPDAKIEFYVHSFISIRGTVTTQKHLCVDLLLDQNTWSIEETYFERLILALAKKIVQIEDLLAHGDCS